jgi:CheY-like chemotaxis protein
MREKWRALILVCALSVGGLGNLPGAAGETPLERGAGKSVKPAVVEAGGGEPEGMPQEASVQLPAARPSAWSDGPAAAPIDTQEETASAANKAMLALVVALWLGGAIAFRRLAPKIGVFLNRRLDSLVPVEAAARFSPNLLAEDQSLAEFFSALRASLDAPLAYSVAEAPGPSHSLRARAAEDSAGGRRDPLQEFCNSAPRQLASLRTLLSEINRAPDDGARLRMLAELFDRLGPIKEASRLPALLPVWQLATALEGLLKQLTGKASNLTPSTLRTVASALDLLEALCIPGLKPDLAMNPPIKILAVDDDPISRNAISFALKKALQPPELATSGEAGMVLAAKNTYDLILLDVQMPGMDGFELCSKIRQTDANRNTPVIFVTIHSDFNSRAKSTLMGGQDLIGKPFLAFELTLKTLTLVLRHRLDLGTAAPLSASRGASGRAALKRRARLDGPQQVAPLPGPPATAENGLGANTVHRGDATLEAPVEPALRDSADAFLTHAPVRVKELRDLLETATRAAEPAGLQDFLGDLYIGVNGLNLDAERAGLRAIHQLGFALEGMLKKLLATPRLCTASTLSAAAAALELLERLCLDGWDPNLAKPAIRLLVVDDDPVARRAICGALQLAFGRPESADSGEAAFALAAEKAFDLIFLDVLMPGMDGFTACTKIHETAPNQLTPVVFVTSHDGVDSRTQAEAAGGCGFISKPVLASEIMLTGLTWILRTRLGQFKTGHRNKLQEETVC